MHSKTQIINLTERLDQLITIFSYVVAIFWIEQTYSLICLKKTLLEDGINFLIFQEKERESGRGLAVFYISHGRSAGKSEIDSSLFNEIINVQRAL